MSAIGDYIHLHTENYLSYGTGTKETGKQSYEDSYRKQKHKNMNRIKALQTIDESVLEELKKRIGREGNKQEQAKEMAKDLLKFEKEQLKVADDIKG
jgi:sensor histidine kinase regulating citrate/malate metabolism